MGPHLERRRHRRFAIDWHALLICFFRQWRGELPVRVVEISVGGARLEIGTLTLGDGRHLLVDHPDRRILEILLPSGLFRSHVDIRWTRWVEDRNRFQVGVSFLSETVEGGECLREEIRRLRR